MSQTLAPVADQFKAGFRMALGALGSNATVTLRRNSGTFDIRLLIGRRTARNRTEDMTQGVDQGSMVIRFMCEDWRTQGVRDPEIGDVLTVNGRRYAVSENPQVRYVNNTDMIFLMDVAG